MFRIFGFSVSQDRDLGELRDVGGDKGGFDKHFQVFYLGAQEDCRVKAPCSKLVFKTFSGALG